MKLKYLHTLQLLTGVFILLIHHKSYAQQFNYVQYMNNLTPLNAAYAVMERDGSINTIARKQWVGISGAPTTFMFNGSLPINSLNAMGGLIIAHDQLAIERLTEINLFLAKAVQLNDEQFLAVSLNGGIRRYVAAYSELDDFDPQARYDVRETRPNVGFGIMLYGKQYYVGVSAPEFTNRVLGGGSVINNNYFQSHYNFSGACLIKASNGFGIKPAVLINYEKYSKFVTNMSGTLVLENTFGLGVNYCTNKEMAGIFTFNSSQFRLGYAYQFGTSTSNIAQGFRNNTHEVSISYRLGAIKSAFGDLIPERTML